MIKLTPTSLQLLASWIALRGRFRLFFEDPHGHRTPAELTVEPVPGTGVRFTLRAADSFNSCTLSSSTSGKPLRDRAEQWLTDCANGRLERAA